MKQKLKLHLVTIVTALIFIAANPALQVQEMIKERHFTGDTATLLVIWLEASLAIAVFGLFITIVTPSFSKFFLGYESKKADEGDEIYYYVIMTLFIVGLCLIAAQQLLLPPHDRSTKKDLAYICDTLNQYDLDLSDAAQDKVDAICAAAPEKPVLRRE